MSWILNILCACALLSILISPIESSRILGLFILSSKSHHIVHSAVADALAESGHDVTVVATHPPVKKNQKYRYIQLDVPPFSPKVIQETVHPTWLKKIVNFDFIEELNIYGNRSLNHPAMKKLMSEESFDIVLQGYNFNDFLFGVAAHFKCPLVLLFSIRSFASTNNIVGNPQEKSYVPTIMSGGTWPMGFFERLRVFLHVTFIEEMIFGNFLYKTHKEFYDANFPSDKYPSLESMQKNVSLILFNHHFSQGPIRPNVPAVIEIGGIQVKDRPDPLPKDIQTILDNSSKHGLIYFSFGTNIGKNQLEPSKLKIIFNVLSKLPQTILWKWGDSDYPGQSPNIIYKSWLPQDDILAHRNVKLFVTHGGLGGIVESQYHGVPMVGVPLFNDQHTNMEKVSKDGFGIEVNYETLTEDQFKNAIFEVLSNRTYAENVQRFSKIYKDRPMTAKETAVFWIEYVLRHHGAAHMQSPAVHLNIFQKLSLDVIGFLIASIYIIFKLIFLFLRIIIKLFGTIKIKKE